MFKEILENNLASLNMSKDPEKEIKEVRDEFVESIEEISNGLLSVSYHCCNRMINTIRCYDICIITSDKKGKLPSEGWSKIKSIGKIGPFGDLTNYPIILSYRNMIGEEEVFSSKNKQELIEAFKRMINEPNVLYDLKKVLNRHSGSNSNECI